MDEAEFDKHVLVYEQQHKQNIAITGEDPSYFAEYKVRLFADWTQDTARNIIDFGSGIGNSIPHFRRYFGNSNLACSDISQKSLEYASRRFPGPEATLKISNDGIPAPDKTFDAAFCACVFHHIPHSEHVFWLQELRRVVRPGGLIAIFEHNPLNPLTRQAVRTCPYDENARLVPAGQLESSFRSAGVEVLKRRYHIFFPNFVSALRALEPWMDWLPIGAQYSVLGRRPRET